MPLEDTAFQFTEAASHTELIFTFTGQGAQWPGMGAALLEHFESFKEDVEGMELALKRLDDPPQWSLKGTKIGVIQGFNLFYVHREANNSSQTN